MTWELYPLILSLSLESVDTNQSFSTRYSHVKTVYTYSPYAQHYVRFFTLQYIDNPTSAKSYILYIIFLNSPSAAYFFAEERHVFHRWRNVYISHLMTWRKAVEKRRFCRSWRKAYPSQLKKVLSFAVEEMLIFRSWREAYLSQLKKDLSFTVEERLSHSKKGLSFAVEERLIIRSLKKAYFSQL
jgi:hypothetical protein